MAYFRIRNPIGTIPGVAANLLPENAAQVAVNCKLVNGNLATQRNNLAVNTPSKAGEKLSIYKFGNFWLHWISDVDVIKSAIAGDTTERTYFTENGEMRVTDSTMATPGGTDYPMDWYKVGTPAPTVALTATLIGTADDPDDTETMESRSYVYTFLANVGGKTEEGPYSPASNIVDWYPGMTTNLSGFPATPVGDYNIIGIRVYRRLSSDGDGAYRFLMDVTLSAGTTNDAITSAVVGEAEEIPSTNWYPPPSGIHSIVNHPGSFVVGAVGNEIAPSEAGQPHAFDPFNRQPVPYDIVALGVVGQGVLILTAAGLWYAAGTTPDSLIPEKVELDQSCVSKNSVFEINGAIGFASPDGLYTYGIGTATKLTGALFTLDQWKALNPSSMLCAYHDGKVFVFYDNGSPGGFIVYPGQVPTKIDLDFHATAVHLDKETDTLYMMVGNDIVSFEGDVSYKQQTWRGRYEQVPRKLCPTVGRVYATDYPITLNLYAVMKTSAAQKVIDSAPTGLTLTYADGRLKISKSVVDENPFRLPSGYLAKNFELECVHSGGEVSEIVLAETIQDLRKI